MAEVKEYLAEESYADEPKRITEVPRLLDRLDKEVAVIGDSVARLLPSLSSVLGQDTPRAVGPEELEACASQLGGRIQDAADKIAEANRVLLNVLGRIEL